MEHACCKHIRDENSWALRPDGSQRPSGGFNVFESGDFWQFHAALLKQLCLTVNNCSNYFTCIMVSKEKSFVRAMITA